MNHVTKLIIALILGLVAAFTNHAWLKAQVRPDLFVGISQDVEPDTPISHAQLEPIPIPGESERLRKTYIPWTARGEILDFPAPQAYSAGDVVMRNQIRHEADRLSTIGPFRIAGLKSRDGDFADTDDHYGRNDVVLVEIGRTSDQQTRALLNRLLKRREDRQKASAIASVQIVKPPSSISESVSNNVLQPVSLRGLSHVPDNLQPGEWIQFVVTD